MAMQRILITGIFVLALVTIPVGLGLAAGPVATTTAPSSVAAQLPTAPPPPAALGPGLGTPNPFATLGNPGSTRFQPGVANPQNNPYPMLPWGDGQIGGERYGQVIRYWEQNPQTVYDVVLVLIPEEEALPEVEPGSQPGAPTQGALEAEARKRPEPQSVTVPGSYIAETTRGYIHMPRWALQEIGGGRHQWVLIGAWFQPK
jgi:hypothetical protein